MSSSDRLGDGVPPVIPRTPIARRTAPTLAPSHNVCLRCAKHLFDQGLYTCDREAGKRKCTRCQRFKKPCDEIPQHSMAEWNALVHTFEFLRAYEPENRDENDAFTQAARQWVADVEARGRVEKKRGGRHQPKGDEILLLQVDATNRVATAVEGILDLFRAQQGYPALGPLDAKPFNPNVLMGRGTNNNGGRTRGGGGGRGSDEEVQAEDGDETSIFNGLSDLDLPDPQDTPSKKAAPQGRPPAPQKLSVPATVAGPSGPRKGPAAETPKKRGRSAAGPKAGAKTPPKKRGAVGSKAKLQVPAAGGGRRVLRSSTKGKEKAVSGNLEEGDEQFLMSGGLGPPGTEVPVDVSSDPLESFGGSEDRESLSDDELLDLLPRKRFKR